METIAKRECGIAWCGRKKSHSAEYCPGHMQRLRKGQDMDRPWPTRDIPLDCKHPGCEEPHSCKGYCAMHYSRWRQGSDMNAPYTPTAPGEWRPWGIDSSGYIVRYRAVPGRLNKSEKQYQHRYVMEQILGRDLYDHENVHHINGVRDDNRPENLELWSTSQPSGQRPEDKVKWAREFLAQYGYEIEKMG